MAKKGHFWNREDFTHFGTNGLILAPTLSEGVCDSFLYWVIFKGYFTTKSFQGQPLEIPTACGFKFLAFAKWCVNKCNKIFYLDEPFTVGKSELNSGICSSRSLFFSLFLFFPDDSRGFRDGRDSLCRIGFCLTSGFVRGNLKNITHVTSENSILEQFNCCKKLIRSLKNNKHWKAKINPHFILRFSGSEITK